MTETRATRGIAATAPAAGWRIERSSFVGRAEAIQQLRGYLDDGARLLTILGAPGLGKTRLLRRLGGLLADEGADVCFCDLTTAATCADVLGGVARELGVPLTGGATDEVASAQLGHALAARGRLVLLLDNFEQVVAHAEATVARWRELAPLATVLTTSRERLGLEDEVRFELQPLTAEEGVRLFAERGQTERPDLVLTDEEREAALRIAEKLEGIPLAIELAAARLAVLLPSEIAARLDSRFELLRSSRRGAPARHLTLERAIDWSFELLAPWERAAFAQCAVFRGGFSLEAAEAVLDLSAHPESPPALDLLQALCSKSVLRRYVPSGAPGGTRFGLFESLREYADRKLDEAGRREAEARHARYYVAAAERWAAAAAGPDCRQGLDRLRLESDNILLVVSRGAEPAQGLRAALALDALLARTGPLQTRRATLAEVAGAEPGAEPAQRVRYLRMRAEAGWMSQRFPEARQDLGRALALARREGDRRAEVAILVALDDMAVYLTDPTEIGVHFQEASAVARRSGDPAVLAEVLHGPDGEELDPPALRELVQRQRDYRARAVALQSLNVRKMVSGELERALEAAEMARAAAEAACDPMFEVIAAAHARALELVLKQTEDTRGLEQACDRLRALGESFTLHIALSHLAGFYQATGRHDELRAALDEMSAVHASIDYPAARRMLAARRGALEAEEGRVARAEAHFAEACSDAHGEMHPTAAVKIQLLEGVLDLARARACREGGRADEERAHYAAARRRLASLDELLVGTTRLGASIEGVVLERAIAAYDAGGFAPRAEAPPEAPAAPDPDLEVEIDGRWFRVRQGERVSLFRRHPMRLILAHLAERHAGARGQPSTVAELVDVGWPGERIQSAAAVNRLHNAIAVLRGLGLRSLLETAPGGYRLAPEIVVRRCPRGGA